MNNMNKMILFVLLVGFAMIFTGSVFSQEGRGSGRLRGSVTDEDGNSLADVKIRMESTSYDFSLETVSDKNGNWAFMGFSKDVYQFTFTKDGFETGRAHVFLSGVSRNPVQRIILKKTLKDFDQGNLHPAAREMFKNASEFYETGRFEEALFLLKEFLDTYPILYMVRTNLAKTYLKLNQYPEAIAEYQKVVEALKADNTATQVESKIADIYVALAGAYQDQDRLEEAIQYYQKAMETIPPKDPAVPFNLAELLFQTGKVDEAISIFEIAAALKPEEGLYQLKLGYAFLNKQDIAAAVKHLENYLSLSPQDPQADSVRKLLESIKKQRSQVSVMRGVFPSTAD